ncbi:ribonucleotide-diphosphate reductase subunit beta [Actinocorallia sp. API 0066]|uniref:ribonucleotide-diphosphate reductase subunit beta n=1 Tax=Actinocorallia sp. API 0066 TaxID=2896846 RepID=UPI001E2ED74B|nr:ribonucleotide-diphosphate reductase subunit beta [Actinocorallia sp. API 0066]MCD0453479.1 ribonucleotide-diphosphate reductase subunit beta [Actinocorallia sp. API 0066]
MTVLEELPDITESPDAKPSGNLPTSKDLYYRWERQQWSVAALDLTKDQETWGTLRAFYRTELLNALTELEVGEVTVVETLSSLVDKAPTDDDRIYLSTQLADEGRHVRFFQTYLREAAGISGEGLADSADYTNHFAPELRRVTGAVWAKGDRDSWYEALVYYHLVTEGVLAATALRTTRQLAKRLPLPALVEGLTNVTRDESRHVAFGMIAARDGVAAGYAEPVRRAYLHGLELGARVLVGPLRKQAVPAVKTALVFRAAQLRGGFEIARDRAVRQLAHIGLPDAVADAAEVWDTALERALDAYEEHWNTPHPVRAAGSLKESA